MTLKKEVLLTIYHRNDRDNNFVGNVEETYYSNISENTACSYESHYKLLEDNCCYGNGVHSALFSYGGNTFFGFEDWEHGGRHNFDLNDVVFMITPEVTRGEIQKMLNRSTISFTKTPKFYLNAFGVIDNAIIPNDCNIAPADATLFGDRVGVEPEHGSTSYLYIWERK